MEIFGTSADVLGPVVEPLLAEKLKIHGGVEGIARKLATPYWIFSSDSEQALSIKNEILGKNTSTLESIRVIRERYIGCMSVNKLIPGDIVLLKKGDLVPANGYFVSGFGSSYVLVNECIITGKTEAVHVSSKNPFLLFGNRVVDGSCMMFVTAVGKTTQLYKLIAMLFHNMQSHLFEVGEYVKTSASSCCSSSRYLHESTLNSTGLGDGGIRISPTETALLTMEPPNLANFTLPRLAREASAFLQECTWMASSDLDSKSSGEVSEEG